MWRAYAGATAAGPSRTAGSVGVVGGPEEMVALVDDAGAVVGNAPRSRVRRENLRHVATAVLLRHPDGRIYVHRRSPEKDWQPSAHDAAAGGILQSGEEPEEAARRELAEELGVEGVRLRRLLVGRYDDDTTRYVAHVFETTYGGAVTHADGEVVWGAWMSLDDLGRMLADPGWPFVPDTRAVLQELAVRGVGDYGALLAPEEEVP
jgi:8-oxo-dGTP pyrophosphatase MutT (NUDIX family)